MSNDENKPAESKLVPTEDVAWGENIGLKPDVLYRRYVGGPNGEEWIPEPDEPVHP